LRPVTQARPDSWLHYGVVPVIGQHGALYGALRSAAVELLGGGHAHEFFFLHKPPGLRVRFQPAGDSLAQLEGDLERRLHDWRRDGLVDSWRGGAYEPEEYLFGGPVSMRSVHRVFTADSLAWLDFHSAGHEGGNRRPGPAWAVSLLMVRALLDALAIIGWEDLDVWDRLRWQAGRRLTDDARRPKKLIAEALTARPGQVAR
jgi:thiopeptide-type bacteriocin biosynthesis protein